MPAREGGSYTVDPKTKEEKLVERTEHPDHVVVEEVEPAPDGATAVSDAEPVTAPPPSGRRPGAGKSQE